LIFAVQWLKSFILKLEVLQFVLVFKIFLKINKIKKSRIEFEFKKVGAGIHQVFLPEWLRKGCG